MSDAVETKLFSVNIDNVRYELDFDAAIKDMTWEEFRAMWFAHGDIPGGGKFMMSHVEVNQGCYDLMSETARKYFRLKP